jgi:hypothetical protein
MILTVKIALAGLAFGQLSLANKGGGGFSAVLQTGRTDKTLILLDALLAVGGAFANGSFAAVGQAVGVVCAVGPGVVLRLGSH